MIAHKVCGQRILLLLLMNHHRQQGLGYVSHRAGNISRNSPNERTNRDRKHNKEIYCPSQLVEYS